jgi:hypothetical protein
MPGSDPPLPYSTPDLVGISRRFGSANLSEARLPTGISPPPPGLASRYYIAGTAYARLIGEQQSHADRNRH